jgi:hypothetical protein
MQFVPRQITLKEKQHMGYNCTVAVVTTTCPQATTKELTHKPKTKRQGYDLLPPYQIICYRSLFHATLTIRIFSLDWDEFFFCPLFNQPLTESRMRVNGTTEGLFSKSEAKITIDIQSMDNSPAAPFLN